MDCRIKSGNDLRSGLLPLSCSAKAEHPVSTGVGIKFVASAITGSSAWADDDSRRQPRRAGLFAGIYVLFERHMKQDVDGREKPGHDKACHCERSEAISA